MMVYKVGEFQNYYLKNYSTMTISVGIFPYYPDGGPNGRKKGAVVIRVKGRKDNPEGIMREANNVADSLNAGRKLSTYPKNILVYG